MEPNLAVFFSKKPKLELEPPVVSDLALDVTKPSQAESPQLGESSRSIELDSSKIENNIPECWTMVQCDYFKEKYDGLVVSNRKLGCEYCSKHDFAIEKGVHVSKGWKNCQIMPAGSHKRVQQSSLRKKMGEHFSSQAHIICRDNIEKGKLDAITIALDKVNEAYLSTTCRIFNTVYSLAKRCRPVSDIEGEVELQIKNGLDMGIGLHSRVSAGRIVNFIGQETKQTVFTKIVEKNLKICLIIDEASTISCKPVVTVFLKVEGSGTSPTVFVELIELEKQDAETIFCSVMGCLKNVGISKKYMEKNLIGFCSDGASVMLGRKSGVSTRITKEFPNIIIWHCLNHRLQLVLDDSIKEIKQINHFETFLAKIYTIFHQSNKNQIELTNVSEQLAIEILKIGRVLGPRWAACSLRSTLAVWGAYPALHQYFRSNEKYSGMAARLENKFFLNDLALMIDILKEISHLSEAMQSRNIDILKAENYVIQSISAFEKIRKEKGVYERKVDGLIASETFKHIKFVNNQQFVGLPHERLLESIITNLKKRLMDCEHLKTGSQMQDRNKLDFLKFLDPKHWNIAEVEVPWKVAEEQLLEFNDIFKYKINVNDYRDFVENVLKDSKNYATPDSIKKAHNIVRTIAVSSAEAEWGFSKMNFICSKRRNRLTVSNITNLMTISLTGLPVKDWDPVPTVKKWLQTHRTADDARLRQKKTESEEDANEAAIWEYQK